MIIRIVGEGQFRFPDSTFAQLEPYDDQIEKAVANNDADGLTKALSALHDAVMDVSTALADDEIAESDLVVPAEDATLDEVRSMLSDNDGLIPNY